MRDMNKKLTMFAILLIIVGIIGTISSGIASVPYFVNTASQIEREVNKETIIFNKELDINKLNINADESQIVIKKHNKKEIIVTQKGINKNNSYEIKDNANELSISQNRRNSNNNYEEIKNMKDVFDFMKGEIYSYNTNQITVYLPKDADINVSTEHGSLLIEDDVLLNELNFKTITGNISLPKKIKTLNDLNITSRNYIQLSVAELLGIKNVKIISNSVNIYSGEQDIFVDNIDSNIPNNVEIIQQNNEYGDVDINVEIPMAKNLIINAEKSSTQLDLPIDKYKINLDLKSLENIDFTELQNDNKLISDDIFKYQNTRELNGNLNSNLNTLEKEYTVKVKSNYISIK